MSFAFIADSHCALRGMRSEIPLEDTLQPLRAAVAHCLLKSLPLVIGGDLYDTNAPPARLVFQVNKILGQLREKHLPIYLIQGNHDKDPETPWGSLVEGVQHIHQQLVDIGGLKVYGLDFAPATHITQQIQQIPKCDVLVLHQALKQGLGFEGAWNCDLDWVNPELCADVLLGDLHNAREELFSTDKKVRGLYPGVQYMTTVDAPRDPSFIVVTGKTGGHLDYQRVALPCRPFYTVELQKNQDVGDFVEHLKAQASEVPVRAIVHVKYPADARELFAALKTALEGTVIFIETPLPAQGGFSASRNLVLKVQKGITLPALVEQRTKDSPNEIFKGLMKGLAGARTSGEVQEVIKASRAQALRATA